MSGQYSLRHFRPVGQEAAYPEPAMRMAFSDLGAMDSAAHATLAMTISYKQMCELRRHPLPSRVAVFLQEKHWRGLIDKGSNRSTAWQ
jgi:hypothetical protein